MSELTDLSAVDAARRIRAGELTAVELVTACLDRIVAWDEDVRAWTYLDPELALREARDRDGEEPRGPLHGIPVGVKDIVDTAAQPTELGSPVHAGRQPSTDAGCVARLRAAGAVILGKTVTTELALFTPGPTTNPHDPTRTPGGSSSGSAAAVADGMVPLALGTQTAGSVVRPASFCGVFGLKPTFGAFPLDGVKEVSASLDTLGHFARDAHDLAVVAGVLAGRIGSFAPETPDRSWRIGFARTHEWGQADPFTRERIEAAVEQLADEADVDDVDLPAHWSGLVEAQTVIMEAEAAAALAPERRDHADRLSANLLEMLDRGAGHDPETVREARALADRCRAELRESVGDRDVLLAPSVLGEAPVGLDRTGDPLFCRMWTLLGAPTVAVPGLRGPAGLPLGVQVVAPHGRDALAIGAAAWLAPRLAAVGVAG
ncbi:MAG: amidase [Nitriliruptorales bacterium]